MLASDFNWIAIGMASAIFSAFSLFSTPSYGQGEGNKAPPPTPSTVQSSANSPPVEQALVPEGVFALQIAEALKLGPAQDAAKAEELLSGLGIEPKNGWITEYPVTPAVLGEVDKGISDAWEQGAIALTKDQVLKRVADVKAGLGIDVNAGTSAPASLLKSPGNLTIYSYTDNKGERHYTDNYDSIPKEYRGNAKIVSQAPPHDLSNRVSGSVPTLIHPQSMAYPSAETVNNYYLDQGPPVVTYYSPPEPYYHFYSWVPYSFWSSGFYFPGFFVLNNFHRRVFFDRHPFFISHHSGPVNGDFAWHSMPSGAPLPSRVFPPNSQTGARQIITLNQNRRRFAQDPNQLLFDTSRRSFLSTQSTRNFGIRSRPSWHAGGRNAFNNEFRPSNQIGFIPQNQRPFVPSHPSFGRPPVFFERHDFNSHRSFDAGVSGRFHQGMEFWGNSGERNFGQGRSFVGGSRGGHR